MFTGTSPGSDSYSIMECPMVMERCTGKWRCSNTESAPNCPRCASSNTKFCYYNNYSLSQPRYFCKGCRRYWTKGGSLRNVPVGGGCRKSRRSRATRQGGATNYPSPSGFSQGCTTESGAATDIDLAAVFAKYVSQNNVDNDESRSPGGSSGSSDNIQTGLSEIDGQSLEDVTMFQYHKPLDLINGGDDQGQLQQVIPETATIHVENNGPDFVYSSGYDLQQGIIGDDLGLLWTDDDTIMSNFEWQQQTMMQLEDLGNFTPDEQFRVSANMSSENWGLFDLSAYEYFSRPS